jgi:hypothetical protein
MAVTNIAELNALVERVKKAQRESRFDIIDRL